MRSSNRPKFNRRNPTDYLDQVDQFVSKQLTALEAYARSARTDGLGRAPSDSAINVVLHAFSLSYRQFRHLAPLQGKHLGDLVSELEACLDDMEDLVARCHTTIDVKVRRDSI